MLDDRDYMRRRPRYELQWSVTVLIVAINVLIFVVQNLVDYRSNYPYEHFALSVNGLKHGYVWQLLTFQFLHAPLQRGRNFPHLGKLFYDLRFWPGGGGGHWAFQLSQIVFAQRHARAGCCRWPPALFWPEHFGQSVVGASAGSIWTGGGILHSLPATAIKHVFSAHRISGQHFVMDQHWRHARGNFYAQQPRGALRASWAAS